MGIEIERKFLPKDHNWRPEGEPDQIVQGYFCFGNGTAQAEIHRTPHNAWLFMLYPENTTVPVCFELPRGDSLELKQLHPGSFAEKWYARVRQSSQNGSMLTIKGPRDSFSRLSRPEYEYPLQDNQTRELLRLCSKAQLVKDRYRIPHRKHVWEVDVFQSPAKGLIICEVEMQSPSEHVSLPDWVGTEVTHDKAYRNSRIAKRKSPLAQTAPLYA